MKSNAVPRILLVDDQQSILDVVATQLRRRYEVVPMVGGPAALEHLRTDKDFAVVLSDLRMPEMDGAALLGWVRQIMPEAVRLLLTGNTDLDAAVAAVNEGQIFRFLRKPCEAPVLLACVDAAVEQHRLITAERSLLEETFNGSIRALTDVLAVTDPLSFGRATRVRKLANDISSKLGLPDGWRLEVAAMLSQLGCIVLPAETVEKLHAGQQLTDRESAMVARVPSVTQELLAHIPRLEDVCAIISNAAKPARREPRAADDSKRLRLEQSADILRAARDYDALEARGATPEVALATLRSRPDTYDRMILDVLEEIRCGRSARDEVKELPLAALRAGMVLAEELRMSNGTLIAAKDYEVTGGFVERVRNFRPGTLKERIIVRVIVDLTEVAAAKESQPSTAESR